MTNETTKYLIILIYNIKEKENERIEIKPRLESELSSEIKCIAYKIFHELDKKDSMH